MRTARRRPTGRGRCSSRAALRRSWSATRVAPSPRSTSRPKSRRLEARSGSRTTRPPAPRRESEPGRAAVVPAHSASIRLDRDGRSPPEGGGVGALVDLAELVFVERADAEEELQLVPKVRTHHLRTIRRDGEGNAALDETPDRRAHGLLVGERLRQQIGRRADLEHDPAVAQHALELRITGGEDPVPDAVRANPLRDLGDLLAAYFAALLSDVDGDAEPRLSRGLDHRHDLGVVVLPRPGPGTGDVDSHDSAARPVDCLLDDDLVQPAVEGPIH